MKHFIVTRFNLRIEQWKTAKDESPVLTKEWLDNRFELFQNYCFPSVVNQKNQDFLWVVFFDVETPVDYQKTIEKLTDSYSNFKPKYIDGFNAFNNSFREFILENTNSDDDFIITSRLDNDDAIHQDLVNTIQQIAVLKHETVIDIRRGYQLNIIDNYHEYRGNYSYSFNPFISLIEKAADFNTVFSREHPSWKDNESIIVYEEKPLWIEVVHKKNKYNYIKLNLPLIRRINLDEFGITKKLKERGYVFIVSYNAFRKSKRLGYKMYRNIKNLLQRKQ